MYEQPSSTAAATTDTRVLQNKPAMYPIQRPSHSTFVRIRTLDYHVRIWGDAQPDAPAKPPPLVLLHGWMDVAASYQFVVDAFSQGFAQGRQIIAPDWRGFGLSMPKQATDCYYFPDYLADLDQLLDHYAPGQAVDLIGHSMGGNIAMSYAGIRPQRVRSLINLEGFGLPASQPEQAAGRYAQWFDELKGLARGELALKAYDSVDGVAQRLCKTNPRLAPDKAHWLAQHWAQADAQGQWRILGDAAHKITSAQLFRVDEMLALYRAITALTLVIKADSDSLAQWWPGRYTLAEFLERLRCVANYQLATVKNAGHMLHHDQPQAVAALIENFVGS